MDHQLESEGATRNFIFTGGEEEEVVVVAGVSTCDPSVILCFIKLFMGNFTQAINAPVPMSDRRKSLPCKSFFPLPTSPYPTHGPIRPYHLLSGQFSIPENSPA